MSDKYDKVAARQLYDRKLIALDEINMVAAILREAFPEPSPGAESGEDFGRWRIRLCWPTEDDVFNKFDCVIDDIGYSDRILTISCPIGESLLAHEALKDGSTKTVPMESAAKIQKQLEAFLELMPLLAPIFLGDITKRTAEIKEALAILGTVTESTKEEPR